MTTQKDLRLAYRLIVIFLVLGIVGYAFSAYSAKPNEQGPNRIMLKCVAGKVLFTHQTHADESGYGISCNTCHHHPEDSEEIQSCATCHNLPDDGSMPASCVECHDPSDYEGVELSKRSDAFHNQCIGCHKENDAGPMECSECHVMVH